MFCCSAVFLKKSDFSDGAVLLQKHDPDEALILYKFFTVFFFISNHCNHTITNNMKAKHVQVISLVRFVLSAFCMLTLLLPVASFAADTGIVKGKITDKMDNEGVVVVGN